MNPSNYQILGEVEVSDFKTIQSAITQAHFAKNSWKEIELKKRIAIIKNIVEEFALHKNEIALLESQEMGMPYSDALIDVNGSIDYINWYLDNAEKYLSPEITYETETELHQVLHEPIGVVAIIIPWNFPLANIIWAGFQSLIAGNIVIAKHSEEVPLCAQLITSLMNKYLPNGVFSMLYGDGTVGWELANADINMLSFVGSTKVGKQLYELAGKKFIKAVMEMGGSAPAIVFPDADLEIATGSVCFNRLLNQGQCCDGLKRAIVAQDILEEFVEKIKTVFSNKKIGSAEDTTTEIGPLVAKRQLILLEEQVKDAISKGAIVITGGKSLEAELGGAFYAPTILTNITPDMRIWHEEVFGPVLPIMSFETDVQAIALANQTEYGLGAYIYTNNLKLARQVADKIESGMVSINGTSYIRPYNPFGGNKLSGIGREHGKWGFHEMTKIKVVSSKLG